MLLGGGGDIAALTRSNHPPSGTLNHLYTGVHMEGGRQVPKYKGSRTRADQLRRVGGAGS